MSKCMLSLREVYLKWRYSWICLYISLREYTYCVHGLLPVLVCTYVFTQQSVIVALLTDNAKFQNQFIQTTQYVVINLN